MKKEERINLAMKTCDDFKRDGIEFIPLPVCDAKDRLMLAHEMINRLVRLRNPGIVPNASNGVQ